MEAEAAKLIAAALAIGLGAIGPGIGIGIANGRFGWNWPGNCSCRNRSSGVWLTGRVPEPREDSLRSRRIGDVGR